MDRANRFLFSSARVLGKIDGVVSDFIMRVEQIAVVISICSERFLAVYV